MDNDILILTCQEIEFEHGYPVLRRVFRHQARTPERYVVWVETTGKRVVHLLLQHSDGRFHQHGDWHLKSGGQDYVVARTPPGFEGAVEVVIVERETGNELASRFIHFGGMS